MVRWNFRSASMRSSRLDAAQRAISATASRNWSTASARSLLAASSLAARDSSAARTSKMSLISLVSR